MIPASTALDGDAIKGRRIELGLSVNQLGSTVGLNDDQIRTLERGAAPQWLPFVVVQAIATALAVPLRDIIAEPGAEPNPDNVPDVRRRLGAALVEADVPVPVEALCLGLDIDLQQVGDAVDALSVHLQQVGITVHRSPAGLTLVPATPSTKDGLRWLRRVTFLSERVPTDLTTLIADIINGAHRHSHAETMRVRRASRLVEAGILTRSSGSPVPDGFTEDAAFALRLDAYPIKKKPKASPKA